MDQNRYRGIDERKEWNDYDMRDMRKREQEGMDCRGIRHVVKKGDTLYQIGKMHQVSIEAIMFANPFLDIYQLRPGDELCIPKVEPRLPESSLPERRVPEQRTREQRLPEAREPEQRLPEQKVPENIVPEQGKMAVPDNRENIMN